MVIANVSLLSVFSLFNLPYSILWWQTTNVTKKQSACFARRCSKLPLQKYVWGCIRRICIISSVTCHIFLKASVAVWTLTQPNFHLWPVRIYKRSKCCLIISYTSERAFFLHSCLFYSSLPFDRTAYPPPPFHKVLENLSILMGWVF